MLANVLRTSLALFFLSTGLYAFAFGNPAWMQDAGFTGSSLPKVFIAMGLGLGLLAAIHLLPGKPRYL